MAAQLLLINPRRKRRRHARKARSHRRRRHVARVSRRRRRRFHATGMVSTNPRRRRRHRRHAMMNPRRRRRRIHRNPFSTGSIASLAMPVGLGALGAVGLDVIYGYLSNMLPAAITGSPYINAAAKAVGAVGLGWAGGKALGRDKGKLIAVGALTVITYQLAESLLKQMAPTIPLAGLDGFGAYMPVSGLGAYMPPAGALPPPVRGVSGFGAYNPAPYLSGGEPYNSAELSGGSSGMGMF